MNEKTREQRYAEAIWTASRNDEGTISATGANIVARAVVAVVDAELAMYKRGAKTLGEIVDRQCMDALDATGLHHLIAEDGDGDWALVWEHLAELRPRAEKAELERDEARAALQRVARALHCKQCGKSIADTACGPTHALLAADPAQHNHLAEKEATR